LVNFLKPKVDETEEGYLTYTFIRDFFFEEKHASSTQSMAPLKTGVPMFY